RRPAGLYLDLDLLVVQFVGAQLLAERILGGLAGGGTDQRVDDTLLGGEMGARGDFLALMVAHQRDPNFDQVAYHLLDVAPDVADLGELGRLDLDERRARKPRQPA